LWKTGWVVQQAVAAVAVPLLLLPVAMTHAQSASEVEQLRKQIEQMRDDFSRAQRQYQERLEALTRRLDELAGEKRADPEKSKIERELAVELGTNQPASTPQPAARAPAPFSPTQPLTVGRVGGAYLNLSFDAIVNAGWSTAPDPSEYLNLGDHDPLQRGFSMRNAEIALDGAVDPYFKGFANIVFKLDQDNETELELEETYLQTAALPANLQLKAGQFFAAFGRQNSQHPHQWAFVDEPVILSRTFGPDGLRNLGAQISWLTPLPFYSEVFLAVLDGHGGTAFSFRNPGEADEAGTLRFHGRATSDRNLRGLGDLLYVPRIASSIELTPEQTLVAGASAAFGPNETGDGARTQIYGVDLYWKWKAAKAHAGFPFLSWQTEAFYERFEAGADPAAALPAEVLRDYGFYSQVLWGFRHRWVAGLRGEYADGNHGAFDPYDVFRGQRHRISPNLTFYPSEFSKVRLQYNYDQGESFGTDHSVWFQVEFLLGAHGAHRF
jgi:hypothetical protein